MNRDGFYWAVVGDGDPEPVAVRDGEAFTIGCADPYRLDTPDCPCRLLPEIEQDYNERTNRYIAKIMDLSPEPMAIPENTLSEKVRAALEEQFRAALVPRHGYAGFGRATRR